MPLSTKKWSRHVFGETNCASSLQGVSEKGVVVHLQEGLSDLLYLVHEEIVFYEEMHAIESFDAASKWGKVTPVLVTSRGSSPSEIYSVVDGETVALSNYGKDIAELDIATAEPFYAKARDGSNLDCVCARTREKRGLVHI
jgi:hypothetical protein